MIISYGAYRIFELIVRLMGIKVGQVGNEKYIVRAFVGRNQRHFGDNIISKVTLYTAVEVNP